MGRPVASGRRATPRYPASPHTRVSAPWSNAGTCVTSAAVVAMLCTSPVWASTPMWAFIPTDHWVPFRT